ncbi:MAG: septal ring lytic transglycosylase RlpA family protein [Pseudomonadota bacterium]|nr:septal ring lytic transglycosylase RlpA family protein [Pseudomonadota bacterium]
MLNLIRLLLLLLLLFKSSQCLPQQGLVSWYDTGKLTASGETYNPKELTAAHRKLPFGSRVRIKHHGKAITVRINDRGPFRKGRVLDLSRHAAKQLGIEGLAVVDFEILKGKHNVSTK